MFRLILETSFFVFLVGCAAQNPVDQEDSVQAILSDGFHGTNEFFKRKKQLEQKNQALRPTLLQGNEV